MLIFVEFLVGCLYLGYSSNVIISGDGSHFKASQHPKDHKDVPFVGEY